MSPHRVPAPERASAPNLRRVAEAAGVSRATASKALNNRPDVAAATRQKVLAAAQELGYSIPLQPIQRTQPFVALVADNMTTFYTLEILKGAATAALEEGVVLLTSYIPPAGTYKGPVPLEDAWFQMCRNSGCVGVVVLTLQLSSHHIQTAQNLNLPLVAIDPANPLPPYIPSIGATNWNGGLEATEHLINLGHTRIAYVQGPLTSVPSRERLEGYLSALRIHGIVPRPNLVVGSDFSYEAGLAAGRQLFALPEHERPTAVFAGSDNSALGVYEAIREAGMRVPEDVSVIGFDDTLMAAMSTPRLTTIRQPLHDMGAAGIRTVLDVAAGRPLTTSGHIRVSTQLIARDSTAPAPAGRPETTAAPQPRAPQN
ncbi:MAG: LacI family DNA-binding transcriptional regulator [Ancrocorticia sp.]|nr:LacI family DNA-binding transcriptional regulator [Ancrocorticia sp.]MCI2002473.1 LacI family DNA-binding transcriptional regulator [Ancrocorticia sp.]MCI2012781.1 LacI family DNA-binding transcriptional regulator [Ancrocorticia sp.]